MSPETMQHLHVAALFMFYFAAICIVANVGFTFLLRVSISFDDPVSDQVFGAPNQLVMRPRFLWPWTPSPAGLATRSVPIYVFFLVSRVTGAGVLVGFLGLFAVAAILFIATQRT
jgi:hypothetical protein